MHVGGASLRNKIGIVDDVTRGSNEKFYVSCMSRKHATLFNLISRLDGENLDMSNLDDAIAIGVFPLEQYFCAVMRDAGHSILRIWAGRFKCDSQKTGTIL